MINSRPQRYRLAFDRACKRQLISKMRDAVNQIFAKMGKVVDVRDFCGLLTVFRP